MCFCLRVGDPIGTHAAAVEDIDVLGAVGGVVTPGGPDHFSARACLVTDSSRCRASWDMARWFQSPWPSGQSSIRGTHNDAGSDHKVMSCEDCREAISDMVDDRLPSIDPAPP